MTSTEAEGLLYSLVRQLAGCATPRKLPAPAPPAAASARELDLLRMRERARALDAEIDGLRRRLSGTPEQREEQAGWDLTQGLRAAWGQLQETLTPERAAEAAAAGGALLPPPPPPPVLAARAELLNQEEALRLEREARPSSESVHHIVKAEVSALDTKVDALKAEVNDRLSALEAKVESKLDAIIARLSR